MFQRIRENWVRPALFFGNNPISLAGGAITSAAGVTMIGYWLVELFGRPNDNPYLGIIFFLILPAVFVLGLLLIPVGVFIRRRKLQEAGQIPAEFPKIDLNDRMFRHGLDIVLVATIVNLLVVSMASYRGAAYMDSPQFCGQSCHVMHPEYTAYKVSAHSHVACVECHIGAGARVLLQSQGEWHQAACRGHVQSLSQADSVAGDEPSPGSRDLRRLPHAGQVRRRKAAGQVQLCRRRKEHRNAERRRASPGRDRFLSHLTGIHGVHLGHIEYIATDPTRTTIPWVERTNPDGSKTAFAASTLKGAVPQGERRVMDCIDCHNRAAHTMQTAEDALNHAMADGAISPELPWVHKKGLDLLKADYKTEAEAREKIPQQLTQFYRDEHPDVLAQHPDLVKAAGQGLVTVFTTNAFPDMKVTWGTHPNHIGHMSYPGCFRCHDGDHSSKDGSKTVTQDCTACHNLLAVDEAKPKVLSDLGIQQ